MKPHDVRTTVDWVGETYNFVNGRSPPSLRHLHDLRCDVISRGLGSRYTRAALQLYRAPSAVTAANASAEAFPTTVYGAPSRPAVTLVAFTSAGIADEPNSPAMRMLSASERAFTVIE